MRRLVVVLVALVARAASAQSLPVRPEVTPPELIEHRAPVAPPGAMPATDVTVELLVAVTAEGRVGGIDVATTGGAALDAVAIEAVRTWTFKPARRGETAIESRIRIPVRFPAAIAPPAPPASLPVPTTLPAPVRPGPSTPIPGVVEVEVRGKRPPPTRSASDFVLGRDVLAAAPRQSAADLLSSAPGIYVARPEGDAVAHEIQLRGFDAEHGQDVAISVAGVPVNLPSHIHGQGYADLGFVIPEVVRSLRVTEGVYDPRQGDFAVAGSVAMELGVAERGLRLSSSLGSFGTRRQLAIWAPEDAGEETFGAFSVRETTGFGENRGGLSGAGVAQVGFAGPRGSEGLISVALGAARASLAGVVRRDDLDAGRVEFYGSYPDPTANAQGALALRAQVIASLEAAGPRGARQGLAVWLLRADHRFRTNFTGYTQRSRSNPDWVGRGDLVEQENHDVAVGVRAFHRTPRVTRFGATAALELGLDARADTIDQAQRLLRAPDNETWDERIDATIRAADLGSWLDADLRLGPRVQVRGGLRLDALLYDVDDRLGNFIPSFQRETHLVGYRRTALGLAWGPRASVEVEATPWLVALAAFGRGFRSPQARILAEGENAPFAIVSSMEVGARVRPERGRRLEASVALFRTDLSSDLAFDPTEGALTKIGPTTRQGVVLAVLARPLPGLIASGSVTGVRATLDAPPPATAAQPVPAFEAGELLPYVPPVVARLDLALVRRIGTALGGPLRGRAGVGATALSPRPLPYGQEGDALVTIDAQAGLTAGPFTLALDAWNLLDRRNAALETSFVSDWQTRPVPSLVPARHVVAAPPRTFLLTLEVAL